MEQSDLLAYLTGKLDQLGLRYFVTGSVATILYGEPRQTIDIDCVVEIHKADTERFCQCFPGPEFYLSKEDVFSAIEVCRPFNIIHPASGLKIDIMVPEESEFNDVRFKRRQQHKISNEKSAWFATPEDVILKKLEYYQQGGSDKHVRDILGVLKIQGDNIDFQYVEDWSRLSGLSKLWNDIRKQIRS